VRAARQVPLDGEGFAIPVEEFERVDAPALDEFRRGYLRASRPVVLTGLTKGWLPASEWTLARMAARYGDARVVAARLANGTLHDDPKEGAQFQRIVLREFIASLAQPGTAGHYVMAPTWNFPDTLQEDYRLPEYCEGAPYMRAKVWVGKGGTMTPAHRDVPHNLHVHLAGRKRWLLFSPADSSRMYSRGLFSGMPNFSQIDPEQPDYDRFPRFRGVTAVGGVVHPGETLFIPHGWWHHTRTLDDALSMNFWWGGSLVYLASLGSTLWKRMRRIRREEWG